MDTYSIEPTGQIRKIVFKIPLELIPRYISAEMNYPEAGPSGILWVKLRRVLMKYRIST